MDKKKLFSEWFRKEYLNWQVEVGEARDRVEFANYLGIQQQDESKYYNGKSVPSGDNLFKIALRRGVSAYDLLEVEPPIDRKLFDFIRYWEALSEGEQSDFLKMAQMGGERNVDRERRQTHDAKPKKIKIAN